MDFFYMSFMRSILSSKFTFFLWKILKLILLMHEFLTRKTAPCKVSYLSHVLLLNFPFHSKESFPIGSIIRRSVLYVRLRWNRSNLKDKIYARYKLLTSNEIVENNIQSFVTGFSVRSSNVSQLDKPMCISL